jgi:signal transduction histidine kinase
MNVALVALAFGMIVITAVVSVHSVNALRDSIATVGHTIEVRDLLSSAKENLGEMEADGLRYMIGGRDVHREGMLSHLDAVDAAIARLRALTLDNPGQSERIERMAVDARALRKRILEAVEIKQADMRAGRIDASLRRMRDGRGESMVIALRTQIDETSAEEHRLLRERMSSRDMLIKQTNATLLIANGLALVAGLLGFVALRRAQREQETMLLVELRAAQAHRASEEKSAFLANMSHEIRTPMNAIFGFAQLLGDHVDEPLQKQWVASIRRSGQMLLALINDVLDLSKIEAGKLQLNPQGTDIPELIDDVVGLFQPMAEAKALTLRAAVRRDDMVPVAVDTQRLRQILMNLLSNAVKYTESGEVVLEAAMHPVPLGSGRDLRIEVRDTGVGIAAAEQERVFEPFYQAESPDGKVRQGTGLGLSITRRLVDLMHGRIRVESRPGEGTVFRVDLPDIPPADVVASSIADSGARADFDRLPPLRILIVDDVEWNIEVVKGYLRGTRHTLAIARDGQEAVEVAREFRPDLVLMDLRMPRMNGYRACEAIRAEAALRATRVVAITASSLTDDRAGMPAKFDGHLRKPYASCELLDCLLSLYGEHASPARDAPAAEVAETEPAIGGDLREEALEEWRALRGAPLLTLRSRMRLREIGLFADRLRTLAAAIGDPELSADARMLRAAVDGFDVQKIKIVLDRLARAADDERGQQETHDAP